MLLVRAGNDLACESHRCYIPFITLLKFWLTFCNKSNQFNGRGPAMLYGCSILNLYAQATEMLPLIRVNIIDIDVMYSTITRSFWFPYVVILINIILQSM